jgi:hypothetical protein
MIHRIDKIKEALSRRSDKPPAEIAARAFARK